MANRRYAGMPADFAMALGAKADLVDGAGAPIPDPENPSSNLKGWAVLVPDLPDTFDVYDGEGNQLTELLDHDGDAVSVITASAVFETAGQMLTFTVVDSETQTPPEGDVFLVGAGDTVFVDPTFRLSPFSDELFQRIAELEQFRALFDEEDWPPAAGASWVWSADDGKFVRGAAGIGTVTSVAEIEPEAGNVPLPALQTAFGLDAALPLLAALSAFSVQIIPQSGPGYATPDTNAKALIYIGTVTPPITNRAFLWVRLPAGG